MAGTKHGKKIARLEGREWGARWDVGTPSFAFEKGHSGFRVENRLLVAQREGCGMVLERDVASLE